MKKYFEKLAKKLLGTSYQDLSKMDQSVIEHIAEEEPIVENVNVKFRKQSTFGQRLADQIAEFGGSWKFIILFLAFVFSWILLNAFYFFYAKEAIDPYPYILLNLMLSVLTSLQGPIIMMSQNRQAAKDRLDIAENYKVSLKTDLEIIMLHQKIDKLTQKLFEKGETE